MTAQSTLSRQNLACVSSRCFKGSLFSSILFLFYLLPKNNSYFEEHKYHGRGEALSFGSWQIFGENSGDECLLFRAAGKVKKKPLKPFPFVAIHVFLQSLSKIKTQSAIFWLFFFPNQMLRLFGIIMPACHSRVSPSQWSPPFPWPIVVFSSPPHISD